MGGGRRNQQRQKKLIVTQRDSKWVASRQEVKMDILRVDEA